MYSLNLNSKIYYLLIDIFISYTNKWTYYNKFAVH